MLKVQYTWNVGSSVSGICLSGLKGNMGRGVIYMVTLLVPLPPIGIVVGIASLRG